MEEGDAWGVAGGHLHLKQHLQPGEGPGGCGWAWAEVVGHEHSSTAVQQYTQAKLLPAGIALTAATPPRVVLQLYSRHCPGRAPAVGWRDGAHARKRDCGRHGPRAMASRCAGVMQHWAKRRGRHCLARVVLPAAQPGEVTFVMSGYKPLLLGLHLVFPLSFCVVGSGHVDPEFEVYLHRQQVRRGAGLGGGRGLCHLAWRQEHGALEAWTERPQPRDDSLTWPAKHCLATG